MGSLSLSPISSALWSFWQRGRTIERTGYVVGALLFGSGLIHFGVLAIGGGSWEGPLSLRKAMTFGLSFGLTLTTIVWVSSFLRLGERFRAALLGAFTVLCVVETALVSLQAWRGVPSHFNIETPFDATIGRGLAIGGVTLVVIIATLTFAALRGNPSVPASLRLAIRIGFLTLDASLVVGGLMIARGMSLVFGGHPQAAYAVAGSLKPIHAVTMHAILVLPALAWLLSFARWSERRRLRVVLLGSAGYLALAGGVAVATISGVTASDASLPSVVLSVLGVLALITAGSLAITGLTRAFGADGIQHVPVVSPRLVNRTN